MCSDVEKYLINENRSIKDALIKIDANHCGIIFSCNDDEKVIGLATDGDIRRAIIKGIKLEDPIANCVNPDFVRAQDNYSREQLIKRLDSKIKFIPIIDESGKLISVISKNNLPLKEEQAIYFRSRAPVRVSFGGGGSDLTHYFSDNIGAVINAAISVYSHGVMRVRDDSKIIITSLDLGATFIADDLNDAINQEGPFGLIQSLLFVVQPKYGFELCLHSDFPLGSGLGGSATISAAVLGCFNMLRRDQWNQHEIAEIAFQAERLHLGISGGWQDQYAAVFGGFNFIEFNADENIVHPIRIQPDIGVELEESLILCDTGIDHHSGNIHDNQRKTMESLTVRKMVQENVKLSYETRNHLLRGELDKFGKCLDVAWRLKRNFSDKITNDHIDSIYDGALINGAIGGKLLGAGGGGYFLFYVTPFERPRLINYLETQNLKVQPFRFESEGLRTWKSRVGTKRSVNGEY